jgi:uncharacterized protein (TIGR03435 family)
MIRTFVVAALGALVCGVTFAQAVTGSAPVFEVASVKVNTSGERPSVNARGDRLTMSNMPLRAIVALAYQVPNDRVTGPGWLDNGFDIVAKFGPDTTRETLWPMLQNLLAERFKLAIHHEQTLVPVYALVVAKNGPKLQEASAGGTSKSTCSMQGTLLTCRNQKMTMEDLAQNFPRWVSRDWFDLPIVDQTGLHGAYDFSLTWTLTDRRDDTRGGAAEASDPSGVSLFDALQDQLGLKLEQRKAPLDRIVVDHAERIPVEN